MASVAPTPKLGLQYSDNNDFFLETIDFLQKIGFVSILSIDMFVKYSFQKMSWATVLQGAEVDTYDNDHMVDATFFVYKITIPRETALTRALLYIKLNQKKSVSLKDIISFVRAIPMFSLLVFMALSFFIPGKIGNIIQAINMVAFMIFLLYFAYRLIRYYFELTKMDNRALQDHTLTYLNPYDLKIFTKEVKEKIDILQQYGITALAIERNAIYLKQDLIEEQQVSILGQILGKKKVMSEEKKEQIMENMLSLLENPEFLATFKEDGTD